MPSTANPTNRLSPKDAGRLHTEIFEQFATQYYSQRQDIYKTNKQQKENDFVELMNKSFCDNQDNKYSMQCSQLIDNIQTQTKDWISTQDPRSGRIVDFEYPAFMEESLRAKLEEVFAVLPMLDENNLDDVLQTMQTTEADIETMSNVNALSKFMALSTVSVAMESTKLWHGVFFEERNALKNLCGEPEWFELPMLAFVISADMIGLLMMPVWLPVVIPIYFVAEAYRICFHLNDDPDFLSAEKILCFLTFPFTKVLSSFFLLGASLSSILFPPFFFFFLMPIWFAEFFFIFSYTFLPTILASIAACYAIESILPNSET